MKETISYQIRRKYTLIKALGIIALAFLMLVGISGATPFSYITNWNSGTISKIDISTNTVVNTMTVGTLPTGVAITPNEKEVYVTNYWDGTVSVINTQTDEVAPPINVGKWPVGVAITPDGKYAYVANNGDGTVSKIDTGTKTAESVGVGTSPVGVAVTPDGTQVYVTNSGSSSVSIINTATKEVTSASVGEYPCGVAISPDGKYAYVANQDSNSVSIIDTNTKQDYVPPISVGTNPRGVAVSPDGLKVYVTNSGSSSVTVINTIDYSTKTVGVRDRPYGVAFTPDGKYAYVANQGIFDWPDNTVSVVYTSTDSVIKTVTVGSMPAAFGQFIVPAPSRFSTINVVGANYRYQAWGQYPLINLFGKNNFPLLSNNDPIWKSHVDKVAQLVNDSSNIYTLKIGDTFSLGKGYSLQVLQVDIDGQKVWLEFDYNGQYVDDAVISTNSEDNTWTSTRTLLEIPNVPILKIHVDHISPDGTVYINGIWLIDYTSARTLKIGEKFGMFFRGVLIRGHILNKIIDGVDASFLGELIFTKYP